MAKKKRGIPYAKGTYYYQNQRKKYLLRPKIKQKGTYYYQNGTETGTTK